MITISASGEGLGQVAGAGDGLGQRLPGEVQGVLAALPDGLHHLRLARPQAHLGPGGGEARQGSAPRSGSDDRYPHPGPPARRPLPYPEAPVVRRAGDGRVMGRGSACRR